MAAAPPLIPCGQERQVLAKFRRAKHPRVRLRPDPRSSSPDFTAIGFNPHTLQFQAAAKACGMGSTWQEMWWWPAAAAQPGQDTQVQRSRTRRPS